MALQEPGPRRQPSQIAAYPLAGVAVYVSEGRECQAKGRILSFGDDPRILGEGDTHVHVEAWWAVANKIPPINIGPEQPLRCVRVCSGSYLRHASSLAESQ